MGKWCGPPQVPENQCGAWARSAGRPCRLLAMSNGRCYMHGGKATGAKKPHKNIKHGLRTNEAMEERRQLTALLNSARGTIKSITPELK